MRGFTFISILTTTIVCSFAAPSTDLEKRQGSGRVTYYEVGLGACGETSTDDQAVVAISQKIYNNGEYCGRTVTITSMGVTEQATVVDECESCGPNDLDLSPSLFEDFAPLSQGVLEISWYFY